MQQSLVSLYACVGAWGVGLVALPLLRSVRLDAEPRMRSMISAFNDSGDASSSGNAPDVSPGVASGSDNQAS